MIALPRDALRAVRSVAKRCRTGRSAGSLPPVRIAADGTTLTIALTFDEIAIAYAIPSAGGSESFILPATFFDTVEEIGSDTLELHRAAPGTVAVRGTDYGLPRERSLDLVRMDPRHDPPPVPDKWSPAPETILTALHEAGRIAARDAGGRYAFHRVQVRRDRIVATDSRQVLIQAGFTLPVPATGLLVTAIPVFASKEFRGHPVQVGATEKHLVLRAGPWTVWLRRDTAGKYPDVDDVIPKCMKPTVATISDADAAYLLGVVPTLPGSAEENSAITLDLAAGRFVVRAKGDDDPLTTEIALAGSTVAGPPVRCAIDRRYLHRALTLGFRTFRFADADKPVVSVDGDRTWLAATLHPDAALPPAKNRNVLHPPLTTAGFASAIASPSRLLVNRPMKSLNGSPPPSNRIEPAPADDLDLLAEAEALRLALVDVVQKVARLVAALKHQRKEKKALTQVWSSLKSLNLGP